MAISQTNAKRVLAYSTIANLGLIPAIFADKMPFFSVSEQYFTTCACFFQIRIFQREPFFLKRIEDQTDGFETCSKSIKRYTAFSEGIGKLFTTLLPIIILILRSVEVASGRMTLGNLFSFYFYLSFLYEPMNNLADYFTSLQVALGVVDRVLEFLEPEPAEESDRGEKIESVQEIRLEDLSFSYAPGSPVLDHFSLALRKGDIVGVIGASGSGKTTLAEILMKLHDAYSGSIQINGSELREISRDSFYRRLSYIDQSPFIFQGTLKENIAFDDDEGGASSAYTHNGRKALTYTHESPSSTPRALRLS